MMFVWLDVSGQQYCSDIETYPQNENIFNTNNNSNKTPIRHIFLSVVVSDDGAG